LSYEEIYRHAYRVVLKKKGDKLFERVRNWEQKWLKDQVRGKILELITSKLLAGTDGVEGRTTGELRMASEKFLKRLRDAWIEHQTIMAMLADVLMYMVRQVRPKVSITLLTHILSTRIGHARMKRTDQASIAPQCCCSATIFCIHPPTTQTRTDHPSSIFSIKSC